MKFFILGCVLLLCIYIGFTPAIVTHASQTSRITIGKSVMGNAIEAVRFGNGSRKFVVVGDTHGGPERNTYVLSNQLIDWFTNHPEDVPADVRLYIIPTLNPDGEKLDTRQNANGVDLNRNMNTNLDACSENDWSQRAFGAYGVVADIGGPYADSEVESRTIRGFLLDAASVVFLHSAAGLIFPAYCEDAVSIAMAQAYAKAGDYSYERYWTNYQITGGMHDWARGIDLPAIVPELESGDEPEFDRNLAGIKALLAAPDTYMPVLTSKTVAEFVMPLPIWRFWQAHGAAQLGVPLAASREENGITYQDFATIRLAYDPKRDDDAVYALPIEMPPLDGDKVDVIDEESVVAFANTDAIVHDAFATYYQRVEGELLLGTPTDNERAVTFLSQPTESQQQFAYGAIRYDEASNTIQRLPVVWQNVVVQQLTAPTQPFQIR